MSPGSVTYLKRLKAYAEGVAGSDDKARVAALALVENGNFKTVTDAVAFVARHRPGIGVAQYDLIMDAFAALEESRKSPVPDMPDAA